jgi:coproporphyrinogen III oxidase-like Fe-S oxidoreductase
MTGFRTSKGVNSTEFFNRFGIKLEDVLQGKFLKYVEQKKAVISNDNYYFLPEGMLFLNQFLVDIL